MVALQLARPAPIPTAPPAGQQATPWVNFDRWSTHPGFGLTPDLVNAVFRAAEGGLVWRQADLFDDVLESDGHLRSLVLGRRDAVAGKEWVIQAGGKDASSIAAAEALEEKLRDSLNFHEFLEHQLMAPYYGWSASEIDWVVDSGVVFPAYLANAPHRRFVTGPGGEIRIFSERNTEGVPLQPGKWVVTLMPHHNLARAGLLRTCTWWALFKRMSVRDWVILAEKFGLPNVIGYYEENSTPESRKALEKAVEDIGEAGQAVLSKATQIVISEVSQRSGNSQGLHQGLTSLCEAQMSKLISGATLTMETGGPGSFALGRVHQARSFSLEVGDAMRLSHVFRQHIGVPFMRYNGLGGRAPRLKIQVVQELDPKTRVEVASILANELGAELDGSQLFDELGFRRPARPEDTLRGTKKVKEGGDGPAAAE
jgi:phage gp29-like protein